MDGYQKHKTHQLGTDETRGIPVLNHPLVQDVGHTQLGLPLSNGVEPFHKDLRLTVPTHISGPPIQTLTIFGPTNKQGEALQFWRFESVGSNFFL